MHYIDIKSLIKYNTKLNNSAIYKVCPNMKVSNSVTSFTKKLVHNIILF